MDITKKIEFLLTEKEEKIKVEIEAHKRIIEIDRQVKGLKRALKDVNDILSPEDKNYAEGGELPSGGVYEISRDGIQSVDDNGRVN